MSTIVKNITRTEYPIPQDTLKLCKLLGVLKHLPTTIPTDVAFELHNTTSEMANAIRRCINSELEVLIMNFDPDDFNSNDNFIIVHELKKRISYIPIRQISGMVYRIKVRNKTDCIIPVYSSSIEEYDYKLNKKKVVTDNSELMFSGSFILTYLRPGKSLLIDNIHTTSGTSYQNGAAFSFPGKVGYKCLELLDDGSIQQSSMVSDPTKYKLSIPRQKYVDPTHIIKMALKSLNDKLDRIYNIVKETDGNYYSQHMDINYQKNKAIFKIFNETYTIGNLITKYGFLVDTTITNIHCIKMHPSFNYVNIEIHHPTPRDIMLISIDRVKKELSNIESAF
jgi:DNA-directed RNA polymerase subunit L